jgi:hypothetical protein
MTPADLSLNDASRQEEAPRSCGHAHSLGIVYTPDEKSAEAAAIVCNDGNKHIEGDGDTPASSAYTKPLSG